MITAEDISFAYDTNKPVIEEVAARVASGEFMAILGNNGVGKSTFLYCLNRILKPRSGVVTVKDRELTAFKRNELAQEVALVAQHSHAGRMTVFDAVLLGRRPYINFAPTRHDHEIVAEVIDRLGLGPLALRFVDELSGGEYQKVVLARALAQETDVLLLDEPTNNLDPYNQHEVMRHVWDVVNVDGIAAIAVMHDLNLSLRYCDTVLLLREGRVYAFGGIEVVDEKAIKAVYNLDVDIIEHGGRKVVVPR